MRIENQAIFRFAHDPRASAAPMTSSRWKRALSAELTLPWDQLFVRQGGTALSLGARTPEGSVWLDANALPVMKSVARVAGKTLSVNLVHLSPACADTKYRWNYRIPTWVVGRAGEDWQAWRADDLAAAQLADMSKQAAEQLGAQLALWGLIGANAESLDLQVESAGRPMPLRDAIVNGPKPVTVMARLDVVLSSALRIEGAFFVGRLPTLGFGRIYRFGSADADADADTN